MSLLSELQWLTDPTMALLLLLTCRESLGFAIHSRGDPLIVKINGETYYLWRTVDHEGELLGSYVTKLRNRKAVLKLLRKIMKHYGSLKVIVTDRLRSYGAAMKIIGNADRQETGGWLNNRAENSHVQFR